MHTEEQNSPRNQEIKWTAGVHKLGGIFSALLGKGYFSLINLTSFLPTGFHVLTFKSHLAIWLLWPSFLLTLHFRGIFSPYHAII